MKQICKFSLALIAIGCFAAASQPAWARFTRVVCKTNMAQDAEIAEGKQYAAQVYGQQPVLPENDAVTKYVQQLGAKLVAAAPLTPGLTERYAFTFHVVASAEINAFALPGGAIFVNLGTIQAAENESQLAGVMAHEISHVIMRHSVCNQQAQKKKSTMYGLGSLGAKAALGDSATGQLTQKGIGTLEGLDFLHMSRGDEQQADLLGVGILYDAGYDPRGLPQFFETIQAKYGSGGHQFLSDHPNPGNRQEYTKAEIATLPPPKGTPVLTTDAFTKAHAVAAKETALSSAEMKSGAWKSSGLYASAPSGN